MKNNELDLTKKLKNNWISMSDSERGQAAPLFRKEFEISSDVKSARLIICGLGYNEVYINGTKVGDGILDPAQTDYEARAFYLEHDVTSHLRVGINAIGVMLGDGWFNQNRVWKDNCDGLGLAYGEPCFVIDLECELAGGKTFRLMSDPAWKCSTGPITENNIYAGEKYDARLEKVGWALPGYDDARWIDSVKTNQPTLRLEKQPMPSMQRIAEIIPKSVSKGRFDIWTVDMGKNFSGWLRIKIKAPRGKEIRLRFAEEIFPFGEIKTASTGVFATRVEQVDTYICKGDGEEIWEPRFTYHGFRYVEITGWPNELKKDDLTGIMVHTAFAPAGNFKCSDERINAIHNLAVWTHRNNAHGLPEDCPARERCGWLGDANMICEFSLWNFDSASFWKKYLDDIETSRSRNDGIPYNIAPGKRTCGTAKHDWMAAFVLIPWYIYVHKGDISTLERHYAGMIQVLERFAEKSENWILGDGLGDWFQPGKNARPKFTPEPLTTTAWFYKCALVASSAAELLGKKDDSKKYGGWLDKIRDAFINKFFNHENHSFGSHTADAMALNFGLIPDGEHEKVVDALVHHLRITSDTHHYTGIFGLRYLFEELAKNGHTALAVELLFQPTYPSLCYLISRDATTLWEDWGELVFEEGNYGGDRSRSHPMLGGYDNFFYNSLAGIRPDEKKPGFVHFFLEPHPVPLLQWARAEHQSPHGKIVSEWRFEGKKLQISLEVPDGTTATLKLPFDEERKELKPGKHSFEQIWNELTSL